MTVVILNTEQYGQMFMNPESHHEDSYANILSATQIDAPLFS